MNYPKTILIFGASGRTGKAITDIAMNQGIKVRGFDKKNPTKDDLQHAMHGIDSVIIVFGPRPPYTDIFCAYITQKIVSVMKTEGIKRLICQTGAMIGDYPDNRSLFFKIFSDRFKKSNPQGYLDRVKQEEIVKKSQLEWTIVKPPRLTDAKDDETPTTLWSRFHSNTSSGVKSLRSRNSSHSFPILQSEFSAKGDKKIKAGENIKVGLLSSVSRKSLAGFIIEELTNPKYIQKTVFFETPTS